MKLRLHRSFRFHTFGMIPLPFLQCSMILGENLMSPIAICGYIPDLENSRL